MRRLGTRGDVEALEAGAAFGGYVVEGSVGDQGGVGRVYVARAREPRELTEFAPWLPLALKVFSGGATRQRSFERRFLDFAGRQAQLRHPNVVSTYDVGASPQPFLVMTLAEGPSLAELIASRRLDAEGMLTIARRVAAALEAGREQGLVYRQLRPGGVLVPGGDPKRAVLGDFGAGRSAVIEADVASNVRALGVILSEGLAHSQRRPELEAVIARALADDAEQRHGTPAELMEAVDRAQSPRRRLRADGTRTRGDRAGARRLPVATGALALVLVGAAALGAIVAPGREDRTAQARPLSAGALTLRYPADWTRARQVPAPAGLTFRDPVAIRPPAGRGGGTLVAGHIGPGALPGGTREAVELDAVQAYRYTGLPAGAGRESNLYAVPTEDDAVAVACVAPAGSERFMADCERVASTLRLQGESPVGLAPSPRYAAALRQVVARLDAARRSGRADLERARTRRGQAAVADRLSRAYRAAVTSATRLTAPPGARAAHAEIVRALSSAARGYRGMAVAGRASSSGGWSSGGRIAVAGERALQDSIRSLGTLGYHPQG